MVVVVNEFTTIGEGRFPTYLAGGGNSQVPLEQSGFRNLNDRRTASRTLVESLGVTTSEQKNNGYGFHDCGTTSL